MANSWTEEGKAGLAGSKNKHNEELGSKGGAEKKEENKQEGTGVAWAHPARVGHPERKKGMKPKGKM